MADPTSTPVPAYMTPLGESSGPRVYLVERLSEEELRRLEEEARAMRPDDGDVFELPPVEEDLRALRARGEAVPDEDGPANDSTDRSVMLTLFVGSSPPSRRMLRTARDIVQRVGERRAKLRVVDVDDETTAPIVAEHRVTFTPTLFIETGGTRTRVVGATTLGAIAQLLPDFRELER